MHGRILIAGLILVALVAGAGYYFYTNSKEAADTAVIGNETSDGMHSYENAAYGIAFAYPDTYRIQERNLNSAGREHFVITLADSQALDEAPVNGEGPTSITFEVFSFAAEGQMLESWVRNANESNFRLSPDQALVARAVGNTGVQGLAYSWDGLYRGESVAFEHRGRAVVASVTSITSGDQIRADFNRILSTLELN